MNALALRFRGRLQDLSASDRAELLARARAADRDVRDEVRAILEALARDGDAALRALAARFDRVAEDAAFTIEVSADSVARALDAIDRDLRRVLERAAANIADVHAAFRPVAQEFVTRDGVVVTRRPDALARVGVYAPGGRAAYPSSVLMGAVPARVAGVREVIVCSPPGADGNPPPVVLAAAAIAGVDRIFAIGGAGAVGAMAFGTQTVPRVDRIVGPGNAWVAEAKAQVAAQVAIDSPAGPSELLVIADAGADADGIACELLAQAEHDPCAAVMLLTDSADLVRATCERMAARMVAEPRVAIIARALAARGAVLLCDSLDEAVHFANEWAPEHLSFDVRGEIEPLLLDRVRNAGTVFIGPSASVAFGDYMTGANHVLPTGGSARSYSGLSPSDFVRWTTTQRIDAAAAARLADDVAALADAEALPAHAAAAVRWRVGA